MGKTKIVYTSEEVRKEFEFEHDTMKCVGTVIKDNERTTVRARIVCLEDGNRSTFNAEKKGDVVTKSFHRIDEAHSDKVFEAANALLAEVFS